MATILKYVLKYLYLKYIMGINFCILCFILSGYLYLNIFKVFDPRPE